MRPWCWNRPDRPALVRVNSHTTIDVFGERIQYTVEIPFFSDNRCRVWDGNDHRIMDPSHPRYGTDSGDHFPPAQGLDCSGCRHKPETQA